MTESNTRADPKIHVYHATAPTCWWSWGYEAVLNRLALVYGDQVKVHLRLGHPWDDADEHLAHYELDDKGLSEWQREAEAQMGVPLGTPMLRATMPPTTLPATLAVIAAREQGHAKAARFTREVLRRLLYGKEDVSKRDVLESAARAAGLDSAAFRRAFGDEARLAQTYEREGHGFPHVPLGFYSLAITDGGERVVILNHAFEPKTVEDAIDWLAGGTLAKRAPGDVAAYLREHGPAPAEEIAKVFTLPVAGARAALEAIRARGEADVATLDGVALYAPVATARSRAV